MELNTNFVDVDNVKASTAKSYDNINTANLEDAQLRQVSNDFEAFFLQQMLDISLKDSTFAGEGSGSDIIKGMYTQAISTQSAGTVGISDMLYNFLSENQNKSQ